MDLSEILSISGKPGLFKLVSQVKNGIIVESLLDGKRFPSFAHDKISSLEEISIFTNGEDLALKEVFRMMFEKLEGKEGISPKSSGKQLKEFFREMVPDFDEERVYTSHIKKILAWYKLLLEKDLLNFDDEEEETNEEKPPEEDADKNADKKEDESANE